MEERNNIYEITMFFNVMKEKTTFEIRMEKKEQIKYQRTSEITVGAYNNKMKTSEKAMNEQIKEKEEAKYRFM